MALTEYEKRLARAYNIGTLLSMYEPRLLESIIRHNPGNEFVQLMQIGKDHREFNLNIPRKDYTSRFKNGVFNGRMLAQSDPKALEKVIKAKGVGQEYRKGLQYALQEHSMGDIKRRMKDTEKVATLQKKDATFQKGFNVGYRLGKGFQSVVKEAAKGSSDYASYTTGLQAGLDQYNYDIAILRNKDRNAQIFPETNSLPQKERQKISDTVNRIYDVVDSQDKALRSQIGFDKPNLPDWLIRNAPSANHPESDKHKNAERNLNKPKENNKGKDRDDR